MTFLVLARRDGVRARILRELGAREEGLTVGQLEAMTKMSHFYIRSVLNELEKEGKIRKVLQSNGRKGRSATLIILGGVENDK